MWDKYWLSASADYAMFYRKIVPLFARHLWLHNLNLSGVTIAQFTKLRLSYYRLPLHTYYLDLNDSSNCPRRAEEMIDDF